MKRREFIAGVGIFIVMQGTALAQTSRKIGYLQVQSTTMSPTPITLSSMRPVWKSLGYSERELILRGADESRGPQHWDRRIGARSAHNRGVRASIWGPWWRTQNRH
jgi:hypothetical protein